MKEGKQRERAVRHHVVNLLQAVEIPDHVATKRVLRPERWQGVSHSGCRDPRPALVEFAYPRHRSRFLASADRMKAITSGVITVEQNDNAISKIKAKDAKGFRQDSISRGCSFVT